ncbi:HAD hydrolase family protein [Faecalicoccus sp. LCP19S3_E3]|uniref:HAD hydrolase family protein n=1 Tax=unclassified Faecalicoccus TaxID=2643311 RepID=UPI003F8F6837
MHTLFFDFDGTLRVSETNEVSKETIQNLRTLRKEGNLIFINTREFDSYFYQ